MARPRKIDTTPPPSGTSASPLTGFRRYNADGTFEIIPLPTDAEPLGGMPRFSGDVTYDPTGATWKAPLYYDGDQNAPYNYSSDDAYALQLALVQAGYMSKSSLGDAWSDTAANAYKRALSDANRFGVSIQDLLGSIRSGSGGGGGGGGGGGLGPAPISDEDITALAQKVSQGVLGRNLRPEELGNFIPAFRGVYQAQETTPQVGAENLIRNDIAPQGEADAHQIGNVMDTISKLLGG